MRVGIRATAGTEAVAQGLAASLVSEWVAGIAQGRVGRRRSRRARSQTGRFLPVRTRAKFVFGVQYPCSETPVPHVGCSSWLFLEG
jgi:hypothetical protein